MKLIYEKPVNQQMRDLQNREHNWRPTYCRLYAQGCIPGLSFEMRTWVARALPDPDRWMNSKASIDALIENRVDVRFIMSELVRCGLDPNLFGYCLQRAPRFGRSMTALLMWHRRRHPEHGHLAPYIDAGRQAWARFEAHRVLGEINR